MKKIKKRKNKIFTLGAVSLSTIGMVAGTVASCGNEASKKDIYNGGVNLNVSGIDKGVDQTKQPQDPKSGINYTKKAFSPWVDNGFNWQQFLGNKNVDPQTGKSSGAEMGKEIINNVLDQGSDVVNLGFITAINFDIAKGTPVKDNFNQWAKKQSSKDVIPSIGGVTPLWLSRWTDGWGSLVPGKPMKGEGDNYIYEFLKEIRTAGKDYTFSFGGWNNDSLAMDASLKGSSPEKLANIYAAVIEYFNLKSIDFDIEGTESGRPDDHGKVHTIAEGQAAKKLRMSALKILKNDDKYKNIHINFTMPTEIDGLNEFDAGIVKQGFKDNLIDRINIMTMDFKMWATETNKDTRERTTVPGEMATYVMSSVNALKNTLKSSLNISDSDAYGKIGIVNMVGVQDQTYELWTITDHLLFNNFAIAKGLATVAFWETSQDTEDYIYKANEGALRDGHTFGRWTYEQMINKGRIKDSYSNGLYTKDLAYTKISQTFNQQHEVALEGNILIPQKLWTVLKNAGVVDRDPSSKTAPTEIDIQLITHLDFVYGKSKPTLAEDAFTKKESEDALTAEYGKYPDSYFSGSGPVPA